MFFQACESDQKKPMHGSLEEIFAEATGSDIEIRVDCSPPCHTAVATSRLNSLRDIYTLLCRETPASHVQAVTQYWFGARDGVFQKFAQNLPQNTFGTRARFLFMFEASAKKYVKRFFA